VARRGAALRQRVPVETDADVRGRGHARIGLPRLVVGDQLEDDEADGQHRDDHDRHEEQGETAAEAHERE
jgi:hypothetical protein